MTAADEVDAVAADVDMTVAAEAAAAEIAETEVIEVIEVIEATAEIEVTEVRAIRVEKETEKHPACLRLFQSEPAKKAKTSTHDFVRDANIQ